MIGDGGFGRDSGTPKRRMLPAVTDVVRELARTASADPAVLFKAARSVVAEELSRVKQGFESAPLDVLVRRARRQLEQDGVVAPEPEPEPEAKSVSIPAPPIKPREKTPHPPSADGPFASAHASDLEWEKDLPIQADDAPFRSAILPLPPRSRAPQEIPDPMKTGAHAPAPSAPPPPPSAAKLPVPDRVLAPEGLAVDRSGSAVRPKPVDDLPLFSGPGEPEPPSPAPPREPPPAPEPEPEPPAFEMAAFTLPEPPSPAYVEPPAPWVETPRPPSRVEPPRFDPSRPSRVEPPPPRAPEPPRFETPPPVLPPPPARIEPPIRSMSEMPPLASVVGDVTEPVVEPEMGEFAFKGREEPPPAAKSSSRTGWLVAIAVVAAVGAGLFWAVRTFTAGSLARVEAPPPGPKKRETPPPPAPATSAPAPALAPPAAKPAAPAKPAAAKTSAPAAPAAAVPKGKAAPLLTPDWTGKPVYVVHFSSHKDRPSAEKEAKKLAGELGKPGRAVEVDLGEKGVWYRVVLGEFQTPEDARAWRAELEAKRTPNLGFVYEMRGR